MGYKLKDLKGAKYNPRTISKKQKANLAKSMLQYGDLSGVVFNKKTGTLISGHQRLDMIREAGVETQIVTKKVKDKHGTVEEGYVVAKTELGELRLPLRVVSWSDKIAEMAANIAANAHGGDFDGEKLGAMLAKIKPGEKFDVDLIGLDPLTLKQVMPKVKELPGRKGGGDDDGDVDENGGTFQSFDENSFEFDHTCPKCKFQYNESEALKAAKKKHKDAEAEKPKKSKKSKKLDKVKAKDTKSKNKKADKVKAKDTKSGSKTKKSISEKLKKKAKK